MNIADLFAKLSLVPDKRSFDAADKMLGAVKTALLGVVAIKTGQWFAGLVKDTTDAASKAVDASQKLGVTAEAYQELGYAAGLSGSSVDGVEGGLKKLAMTLDKAKNGGKEQAAALRAVGLSSSDASVKAGDLDEVLMKVADRIADMPDGAKKTALAMKLFGKSGADLIPLLNLGADGIGELRKEARELGVVIDNETAASLEEFGDDQDRVKAALTGLRNEAVKALLPTLRKMVTGLLEWVKANRKLLAQKLERVMRVLATALMIVAKAVVFLVDVIDTMIRNWELTLVVLASVGVAYLALSAKAVAAGLAAAAAWVAANAPIVLLGLLIAGAVLIVEDLWRAFTGGESVLKNLYLAASHWIGDKLASVLKIARGKVNEFLYGTDPTEDDYNQSKAGYADLLRTDKKGFAAEQEAKRRALDVKKREKLNKRDRESMTPEAYQAFVRDWHGNLTAQVSAIRNDKSLPAFQRVTAAAQRESVRKDLPPISISVTVPPGTDGHGIAGAVRRELDAVMREAVLGGGSQ